MAEFTRERERGAEPQAENHYEVAVKRTEQAREAQLKGKLVGPGTDWQQARQGLLRYFVTDDMVPLGWSIFQHHIKVHSGKHRHQGGLLIYCLKGRGYSVVDGVRIDWSEGDLILLPIKPGGVEHQHFNNGDDEDTHWVAFVYHPFTDVMGNVMRQLEVSPEYKKA